MHRRSALVGLFFAAAAALAYAPNASGQDWVVLFDGKNLDNFAKVGDANWRIEDGAPVAPRANGSAVAKASNGDFQLRAESRVGPDAELDAQLEIAVARLRHEE